MQSEDNIAIFHTAPRLGDLLIHMDIYFSIYKNTNKKIIFICGNKELANIILGKFYFIEHIIEFKINKSLKKVIDFYKFFSLKKKFHIKEIYIIEKNINPVIFAYFTNIKNIYSFGLKKIQTLFINNKKIHPKFINEVEYDLAYAFLNVLKFNYYQLNFTYKSEVTNSLFLCNHASDEKRKWPKKNFKYLISKIINQDKNIKLFLNISSNDFNEIKSLFPMNVELTIGLSLVKLIEVIKKCRFVFSIDTGPSHLSLRLSKKTYVIFSSTIPQKYSDKLFPIISDKIINKNKLQIRNNFSSDISVEKVWDSIKHEFNRRDVRVV